MANGRDPILDALDEAAGGVAVAEPPPEEKDQKKDPVFGALDEAFGKAPLSEAERAHITQNTGSGPTLEQQFAPENPSRVTQMGEQVGKPMIPMEAPHNAPPYTVKGPVGQTLPSAGLEEITQPARVARAQQETIAAEPPIAGPMPAAAQRTAQELFNPRQSTSRFATQGNRIPLEEIIPEDVLAGDPAALRRAGLLGRGLLKVASSFVTPSNAALFTGMTILPPAAQGILSILFTGQFFKGTADDMAQIADDVRKGDWDSAAGHLGEAIPNVAFTVTGVKNMFEGAERSYYGIRERAKASAGAEIAEQAEQQPGNVITVEPQAEGTTGAERELEQPTRRGPRARPQAEPEEAPQDEVTKAIDQAAVTVQSGSPVTSVTEASPEEGAPAKPSEPPKEEPRSVAGAPQSQNETKPSQAPEEPSPAISKPAVATEELATTEGSQQISAAQDEARSAATAVKESDPELAQALEDLSNGNHTPEQLRNYVEAMPDGPQKTELTHAVDALEDATPQDAVEEEAETAGEPDEPLRAGIPQRAPEVHGAGENQTAETEEPSVIANQPVLSGEDFESLKRRGFLEKGATLQPTEVEAHETEPTGTASNRALEGAPSENVPEPREERETGAEGAEGGRPDERRLGASGERGDALAQRLGLGEEPLRVPAERGGAGEAGEGRRAEPARLGRDYRITDEDRIGEGGPKRKYADNVAAIRTLKQIEREGRLATPEEQAQLVKYVGWGGMPQVFDSPYSKDWGDEYQEIKDLLGDDEYEAARASTPNAHYTSAPVVRSVWDAVRRLGFSDGRLLEPSAGTGNFLGLMPSDIGGVRRTAVELDSITGRILKALYPRADVRIQGFEKFKAPNGFYDLVVGNVPFGDYQVHDPDYTGTAAKFPIHNYFILKSLDKLRPGGVAAVITSSGTMDSAGNRHRQMFADRADLIGAIRLPKNTFQKNALTDVTTDILFFRKRAEDEPAKGESFLETKEIPGQKNAPPVNEYFARHPEMMLGTMGYTGTRYTHGLPELSPDPDRPLAKALPEAIAKLPENVMAPYERPESTTNQAVLDSLPDFGDVKPFGLKIKDGKVYRRVGDSLQPEEYAPKQVARLKGMLRVRDAARELVAGELSDKTPQQLSTLRGRLNRFYDEFTSKNNSLHFVTNQRAMREDPDLPFLLALENYDPKTKVATKADIFTKRTVAPHHAVEKVESSKDAMVVSLNEKGRLDFDYMGKVSGKTAEEMQADLKSEGRIFENPSGGWEPSDEYLSGNVRAKLAEAESAALADPKFEDNVKALRAVQPKDKTPGEIKMRLGAPWVPTEDIEHFIEHLAGTYSRDLSVRHVASEGMWTVHAPYLRYNVNITEKWGTARMDAIDLIDNALNLRSPIVYDTIGSGDQKQRVVNEPETLAAKEKTEEIHKEFREFLMGPQESGDRLAKLYNEKMNNLRLRQYDGSHLTLPGSSSAIKLTPIQKDDIWRAVADGNMGLYEPVGAGKTFIMTATAMEWRRLGRARKIPIVVPNAVVEQFARDFQRLYPGANILTINPEDLSAAKRKEFQARIGTGDWDAVIVPHSAWERIGVSDDTFNDFMQQQMEQLSEFIEEMKAQEGKKGPTVKELEKAKKRLEVRVEKRLKQEAKDRAINFEELGFDGLIVDEAHNYKSLYFHTKMGRVAGVPRSDSDRALDMYLKTQYVSKMNNGRNVVFATGTPVTNTMAEMWNMMRYLDDGQLKQMGLEHFDSWAAQFGVVEPKLEVRPEDPNRMRIFSRFRKFQNLRELIPMFRNSGAMHSQEELKLPKPELAGGKPVLHVIEPSPEVEEYIKGLGERADKIRGRKPEKGADNMLRITTEGRKVAIDLRFMEPGTPDNPGSKINEAVRTISRIYQEQDERKGTQLVMLDMGIPGGAGFNAYADIKNKLVGQGVVPEHIKFIHDFPKPEARQELFNNVNDGDVRILLGSTPKVGVGVNIQNRLFAIHHIDVPWRPADIEQRNGRILRQGNTNPIVEEHRYITKRTFDAYSWQLIEDKANMVNQAMHGETDVDEIEDVDGRALTAAEAKAMATGNPLVMEKIKTDLDVSRLEKLARAHEQQQFNNRREIAALPERISGQKQRQAEFKADIKTRDANKQDEFSMAVRGKTFADRKEAGAALNEAVQKMYRHNYGGDPLREKIGTYRGFDLFATSAGTGYLVGKRSYEFTPNFENPLGTLQSVDSKLRGIDDQADNAEQYAAAYQKELQERQAITGKAFPQQAELDRLVKRKKEIDEQLAAKPEEELAAESKEDAPQEDREEEPEGGALSMELFPGIRQLAERALRWLTNRGQVRGEEESQENEEAVPTKEGIPEEPPQSNVGVEHPTINRGAAPRERAVNIRLDKLNAPDEVLDEIRQIAKDHADEINEQRRGKITNTRLREMAAEVGLDVDKISKLPKGRALNPEELLAARMTLLSLGEEVRKAAAAARASDSSENLLKLWEAQHKLAVVQKSVSGAVAEAGRALQQQKIIAGALKSKDKPNIERVLEQLGGRELTEEELHLLSQIPEDDVAGYYKFLRNATRFNSYDKMRAYWMANILSTPHAFERKALGDLFNMGMQTAARFARSGIDIPASKLQGRKREFYFRDAMAETAAMVRSFPEGARLAAYVIGHGFTPEQAEAMEAPKRYELAGGSKNPLNYPGRMLNAATTMMKTMILRGSIKGQATRMAIKEGAKGAALAQRVAQLVDDPTDAMMNQAMKDAAIQTFTEKPDAVARMAIRMREMMVPQDFPVIGGAQPFAFVVPFIQVPWNIAKTSARFSPLGAARAFRGSARGKPESSNIWGQALVGSLIMAALAAVATEGNLTGAAPRNQNDRDAWYSAGNEPYSIKIGNHWVNYLRGTGALALLTAAVAGFHDAFREDNKAPASEKISQVAALLGRAIVEQSFFQGLANLVNALEEPERYGQRFITDIAEGFVPMSGALRTATQAIDPTIRDPKGMYEHVVAGLPFASKTVPPKLDAMGREVRSGSSGAAALAPMPIGKAAPESDVDAEMERLHALGLRNVGFGGRSMVVDGERMPLDRGQQSEYQRLRGALIRAYLDSLFTSGEYSQMQDDDKVEAAQDVIQEAEKDALDEMRGRLRIQRAKAQSGVPFEPPSAAVQ